MKRSFLALLFLLLPSIASAQAHKVCPSGQAVVGSKGPPDDCAIITPSSGIVVILTGAAGDGVTDDALAICNAYKSVPANGTLLFPSGNKTYLVNSNPGSHFYSCDVTPTPVNIDFNGSTILVGAGVSNAVFGVAQGTLYSALVGKLINAAHRGDTTVTTITAGDAANFTVGHVIYCHGEISDNLDKTEEIVTSIDAGTGILGLQWPLGKDLISGTPACADADAATLHGIYYQNGNVRWVAGATAQFVIFTQIYRLLVQNMNIDGTLLTAHEPIQGNNNIDTRWVSNTCSTKNSQGGCIEIGGNGSVHAYVAFNTVNAIGTGSDMLGSCEGCEGMIVDTNWFSATGSGTSNEMIDMSSSYDFIFNNNHMEYGAATIASGHALLNTNTGGGGAIGAIISNNSIVSYGPIAILSKGVNDKILGNQITTAKFGIDLANPTTPVTVVGNSIALRGTTTGVGIQVEALQGAESSTIVNNSVTGDPVSSGTCVQGIALLDPGTVKTWVPVVTNNNVIDCTTPIQFTGSSATNLPKRIVTGNSGYTDFFTFANIANVLTVNGQQKYCSDCTIVNPCAGSGTGAQAKLLNGVDVCN